MTLPWNTNTSVTILIGITLGITCAKSVIPPCQADRAYVGLVCFTNVHIS